MAFTRTSYIVELNRGGFHGRAAWEEILRTDDHVLVAKTTEQLLKEAHEGNQEVEIVVTIGKEHLM